MNVNLTFDMKKILAIAALFITMGAFAQVQEASMYREGNQMKVNSRIQLTKEMLKGAKAFVLTPQITDGENVVKLSPIGMYSKDKFYPYLQDYGFTGAPGEVAYTKAQLPTVVTVDKSVPYETWMDGSRLELVHEYVGCCGDSGFEALDTLASYSEAPIDYTPMFREVAKDKMTKVVAKKGQAKVTFPLNVTTLNENYQDNAAEIEKIAKSIEEIKNANEVDLKSVVIKGQSSPEGKFSTNERLSRGRTKAVVDYISSQYDFGADVLEAESVGENWEGLRAYVESSSLKNKAGILEIIDSDLDPDAKEQKIRSTYPQDWNNLHKNCFPYLRVTSYEVLYETIDYENVNTHISLAYDAMDAGEYRNAANHLALAGDSADAEFARGTLAGILKDYKAATEHFQKALDGGIQEAAPILEEVSRYQYMKPEETTEE